MAKRQHRCSLKGCKRKVNGLCTYKREGCIVRLNGIGGKYRARCKVMYS